MKYILSSAFLFFIFLSHGQSGVRGVVTDAETKETLPFGTVMVKGSTSQGAQTDFDGGYEIKLKPGTYDIVFLFTQYEKDTITVEVKEGLFTEANLELRIEGSMKTVEVVYERKQATDIGAIDGLKRESSNVVDGDGAKQMKARGDSDAGESAARVTGVSVVGGREVYVRGLGDRYIKTTLNGMEIPGLDPDKNTVQMDIFPTNLIDNIMIYKTFSPNLPGDFTGGLVNISTKDLPSEKYLIFSANYGFNSQATFNPNYISYKGGSLDFLGFDDGTRALPVRVTDEFPHPALRDEKLTRLTKQFNSTMGPEQSSNFLNQTYSFGYGNVHKYKTRSEKPVDYGYNFVVNYKNTHSYNQEAQFNAFRKEPETNLTEVFADRTSIGPVANHNVIWSALIGQSIKYNENHRFTINFFHTQNGSSSAARLQEDGYEINQAILEKTSLQYTQRSVSNVNILGKHNYKNNWSLNWGISPSLSKIDDPDIRSTILEIDEFDSTKYLFTPSVGSEIRRIFRYLDEKSVAAKFDLTKEFKQWKDLDAKVMFGASEVFKMRTFNVYDYVFGIENVNSISNDPNWFFEDENIWTVESDKGTYGTGARELANSYDATSLVIGGYAMNELPINERLKTVYGARVEKAQNRYTGQNNLGTISYVDTLVLDELNILPSFSFVYALKDTIMKEKYLTKMNLRGAYSQTVARPTFREKSISQVYDPIQGRRYNGNLELLQTNIHNVDFRWEYYYGRTEVLSASLFYKQFINPIEIISFDIAPNEVKPINSGVANLYGVELEARKRFGFIDDDSKKLFVGVNYTYINSQIDMNQVVITKGEETITEKELREANARDGETIGNYRSLYGQSPYIVNANISYSDDSLGLNLNLSYNVQGKRLAVIGIGRLPDVFEQPFHSLNFKGSKVIDKKDKWTVSLTAKNLLNNSRRRLYESYMSTDQIYDFFYDGFTISAGISYKL